MFRSGLITFFLLCLYAAGISQKKGIQLPGQEADTTAIDFNRRFALVIGNAKYEKDSLRNPVNDANRVAALLEKYGFKVMLRHNLGRREMNSVINEFGDSITARKGVSFFFYSGHGIQYNAQNYLLPLKTSIEKETDIEDEAVKLAKLLDRMRQTRNGLNVVILDACRNNPFYESIPSLPKGLTDKETLPGNTSVLFATTPGNIALDGKGNNSPFTEALTEAVTDSIEFYQVVRKVVKQVKAKTNPVQQPAVAGSPEDEFYFTRRKTKPRLFILSIGNAQYQYERNLMYPAKDAKDVAASFVRQQGVLYDSVYSTLLIDAAVKDIKPAIRSLRQQVRPGDVIVLFLAGNIIYDEKRNRSFFLPVDAKIENDNDLVEQAIIFDYFRTYLTDLPCKSILFLEGNYQPLAIEEMNTTENGMAIFASSLPGQANLESTEWQNGLFAKAVIDGVRGAAAEDVNGNVSLRSLAQYLETTIQALSKGQQKPATFFPPGFSNFILSTKVK